MMRRIVLFALALLAFVPVARAVSAEEPPALAEAVAAGKLPPLAERLPRPPRVVDIRRPNWTLGRYGGEMRMLMGKDRDIRMMVVYGYSRLVGYDEQLRIVPDILERMDNEDGKVFTLHLRQGHRWSDGHPFTAADFRYYWEDVVHNKDLSPFGLPQALLVKGRGPRFEILNDTTIRYSWDEPNPQFLAVLAGPSPLYIFRPAHYLRQFHPRYIGVEKANDQAVAAGSRSWAGLHQKKDEQYRFDNPDLPTLEPWINTTPLPSTRFVLVRNPFFHRIDTTGRQLPYIDRVIVNISDDKLIPAKAGAGDVDLQARYLRFDNYTFLKQNERRNRYKVLLWEKALGSQMALYPNLNVDDPEWRKLMRDVRFRRALSLAINRHEINEVVYFGLGQESSNTVLQRSPLFRPEFRTAWSQFDVKKANALLDELGLAKRDPMGLRLLPDGRPMEIVVDTSGESTEETDVLELVRDSWRKVGIALFSRPSQREVFRKRVFSGKSMMSVWSGLNNGIPTPDMSPSELAPTTQDQLQWPMWGQYYENNKTGGQAPDMPEAKELVRLYDEWRNSGNDAEREKIWLQMLEIHAQQVFTIGIVTRALQPVVVQNALRNVPAEGVYSWDPGRVFRHVPPRHVLVRPQGPPLMLRYVVHRVLLMIPTLIAISLIIFVIIQLPPGDYLESYIAELQAQGESVDPQKIAFLREYYGLDKPLWQQYLRWAGGMLLGDFGYSFEFNLPVSEVVGDRLLLTDARVVHHDPVHVGRRLPHRHLFGDPPVQLGRLRPVADRLPRHRDAELHAGAGHDVSRQRLLRDLDRRTDGPRVHRRAVVVGQVHLGARAHLDTGDRDRHPLDRGDDPAAARQPAGRTAEAVRGDRPRQGPAAAQGRCSSIRCGWRSISSFPTSAASCRHSSRAPRSRRSCCRCRPPARCCSRR